MGDTHKRKQIAQLSPPDDLPNVSRDERHISRDRDDNATANEVEIRSLPPTDHGRDAYLVLECCRFSLAFGVFQEYYTSQSVIKGASSGSIATAKTTLNGIMYLMMPLSFSLLTRYPLLRPYCGPLGLIITVASVLCALGSGLLFSPITLCLNEWFIARKGMAYGVLWGGKSAAGVTFPFLITSFLNKYGAKSTLQIWAVTLTILTLPLLFFLKPRIPLSAVSTLRPLSWAFLKHSTFWMLQLGNVIYLPSITGALLISIFSLASTPGGVVHGILSDHHSAQTVIMISSAFSAFAVFLLWRLSKHLAPSFYSPLSMDFSPGGFGGTYPGILRELKRVDEGVDTGLVMEILLGWGYTTEYRPVIVCTGGGGGGCGRWGGCLCLCVAFRLR
ncbi:putative MFS monocarboxylate transporter [Amylocarpus encephaloides]|uniref:MFS monocarboxylate transporter n=1 Tax=Amylocarpus encephaloides TaxID=45428 RepID=A0A9P8C806_9HELO|nr:putative MFS monocarboxylate transporter [Amylocarpus encephaloides]